MTVTPDPPRGLWRRFDLAWRSGGNWAKVALAAGAFLFFMSGLVLVWVAWGIWKTRESGLQGVLAMAVGAVGAVWFGVLVMSGTSDRPDSRVSVVEPAAPVSGFSSEPTVTVVSPPTSASSSGGGMLVLDLLQTIVLEKEHQEGYARDLFPTWSDLDGDGCDTRAEVLIRDAVGFAEVSDTCKVLVGSWYSVYDDLWFDEPIEVSIDHVVALKEAWDSGAWNWDPVRREAFANDIEDPHSLIAVSSSSNQDKGAADPSNWLPPNEEDRCRYVTAWVIVKARWALSMDESEFGRIANLFKGPCKGFTVADGLPGRQVQPATTTPPTVTAPTPGASAVSISSIVYDAPGNDMVHNDSEYVVIRNDGGLPVDVGRWRVTDSKAHSITIPAGYIIAAGGILRVYTGTGESTDEKYFAGQGQAIWNNSGGDTATLWDATGEMVDTYSYQTPA